MRIETNERLVKRNRRTAHILFFFSMAILAGGFIIANTQLADPNVSSNNTSLLLALLLPWVILPIGFVSTIASVRMTNLWIRQPRPEAAIQDGLKGVSKKSVLYNYYHFPARHVLVCPQGVFAIITRFQDRRYTVEGEKWREPGGLFNMLFRVFRQDSIRNPFVDAQKAAAHVQSLLGEAAGDVVVQPMVIFADPRASLEVSDPIFPVLYADSKQKPNLTDYLRDLAQSQKKAQFDQKQQKQSKKGASQSTDDADYGLSNEQIAQIASALDPEGVAS
ncbi:MAG: NERD domain-containing protein [Anaerolineaceae bacterium]|nr:NERD domain-containing protein [Anaerolineaceae bacterium]